MESVTLAWMLRMDLGNISEISRKYLTTTLLTAQQEQVRFYVGTLYITEYEQ